MYKIQAFAVLWLLSLPLQSAELADPTRPLNFQVQGKNTELKLHSILIRNNSRSTVINGQQLREQQVIKNTAGVKVIRIEPYQVLVQKDEKQWTLKLRDEIVIRQ